MTSFVMSYLSLLFPLWQKQLVLLLLLLTQKVSWYNIQTRTHTHMHTIMLWHTCTIQVQNIVVYVLHILLENVSFYHRKKHWYGFMILFTRYTHQKNSTIQTHYVENNFVVTNFMPNTLWYANHITYYYSTIRLPYICKKYTADVV